MSSVSFGHNSWVRFLEGTLRWTLSQCVLLGPQAWLDNATVLELQKWGLRQELLLVLDLSPRLASGSQVAAAVESRDSREAVAYLGRAGVELGPLPRMRLMHRSVLNRASVARKLSFETGAQCNCVRTA